MGGSLFTPMGGIADPVQLLQDSICAGLNLVTVACLVRMEFWFAMVKITAIIVLDRRWSTDDRLLDST